MNNHKPAFLVIANFSNNTGYAWHNIYKLIKHLSIKVAQSGLKPIISFAEIEPTNVDYFDHFEEQLQLDADLSQTANLDRLLAIVKQHNVKTLYLTDQRSTSSAYAKLRKAGVEHIISHCRVSVANPYRPAPENPLKQTVKWLYSRIPGMTVDKVICVSDFVKYRLQHKAKIPASKLITVHNGVDTKKFYSEPLPYSPGEPVTLFTSGRATSHKGIKELIEAVAIVNETTDIAFNVRYAGDGPEKEQYQQLAQSLGVANFAFLGQLPSVEKEIHNAHILIMPSAWGDAFPSAVTESLASGRPLITTEAGGIPEIVGKKGNAVLVPPGNAQALAEAIKQLLEQPQRWNSIAEAARAHVTNTYTTENYYNNVWQVIAKEIGV